jgi:hypothetical protein
MQTSYSQNLVAGFPGLKYDGAFSQDIVTGENVAAAHGFGKFACLGAGPGLIALPAAAADITDLKKAIGVVLAKQDMESSASGDPQYPVKSAVPVMKKGRVWVNTESAVTAGSSDVHVRYVAGSGSVGAFRGAAVASETAILPDAKWLSTTTGAGLALLEINL